MDIEDLIKHITLLIIALTITIIILGYANFKNDFSKRMDSIILTTFIIDAFILIFLVYNTWF